MRTGATTRTWRMRQWPNDPSVAHLVFLDHHDVPTAAQIEVAIEHARRRGARALRTSALFPRATTPILEAGFHPIDRLALLRRDLSDIVDLPEMSATRPMLSWHHRAAAHVDRSAFGPLWGNDAVNIREIRHATPEHRARIVRHHRSIVGFAVSGAAGDHGYLQRLAVLPAHQRDGFGTVLVVDALHWMHDSGLRTALVNTGLDNAPALSLYDRLGFELLDEVLVIAELPLD